MVIIRCPEESERLFQMERSSFDGQQFTIMKKLRAQPSAFSISVRLAAHVSNGFKSRIHPVVGRI